MTGACPVSKTLPQGSLFDIPQANHYEYQQRGSLRSWQYYVVARLKFWRRSRVPKKGSRDEAVFLAAPPSNLTRLLQYRQLRRLAARRGSLPSKRFQSSYGAKVRGEAKKGCVPLPLPRNSIFFFCSCPSFLDEPREETLATQASSAAIDFH